jgi:hypothetical protein
MMEREAGDPIHEQAYKEREQAYRDAHSAGEKVKDLKRIQYRRARVDNMNAQLKSMREQGHDAIPADPYDENAASRETGAGNTAERFEAYRKLSNQRDKERARAQQLHSETRGDEQWNAYNYVPLREMNEKVRLERENKYKPIPLNPEIE